MSKFAVLVKQLYKQKVSSKSFILMTAFYVIVIGAVLFWSDIKEKFFSGDGPEHVAIINQTSLDVEMYFEGNESFKWHYVDSASVLESVDDITYLATIHLVDENDKLVANIESLDPLPLNTQTEFSSILSFVGQMFTMSKLDLTPEQQNMLLSSEPIISMIAINLSEGEDGGEAGKTTDEKQAGIIISYVVGFIIYFFVFTYLSMITTEVASEKGSRALEMLLVSVKPEIHFRAKIVGVSLVALTQFLILFGSVFVLVRFVKDGEKWALVENVLETLSLGYFLYIIGFLFFTIFLYLVFGALFGSLVSKVEEAGQVMMPALMLTLVGFYIMIFGMMNPDTMLIKVASHIPFTSGMVMPMRIGATDINAIEPIISLVILAITTIAFYFISLSFYKRSVLTYSSGGIIEKIKMVFKVTS